MPRRDQRRLRRYNPPPSVPSTIPSKRMPRTSNPRPLLSVLVALASCATALSQAAQAVPQSEVASGQARKIDFNRDIRPLLSDRCFKCHGFDARARKAGLRLDTWEGLTREHKGRRAVAAHKPDASELIRRIESKDPRKVMPPPNSGATLSPSERELLARWIKEGADFDAHWAYVAPKKTALPPPPKSEAWRKLDNPIDRFIAAKIDAASLPLSAMASRETLIRRVSLDLIGLPPTPREIDAFLADNKPGAYERLVDRLLASKHFGERMAIEWLDSARYADTNGYHHDNVRTAWPYRNWVIDAFNRNLAFDRFVIEQLAGDLLPNPSLQQKIATAFCRMHNINDEGGALDKEYRVEAVCDRIETIATTFMGLTFNCARCHNHKYDPITQEDYYSVYAFFNSVEERGVYRNNGEQARAYPARISYASPEIQAQIDAAKLELAAAKKRLVDATPKITHERRKWEATLHQRLGLEWVDAKLVKATAKSGSKAERMPDGSVRFAGKPATDRHSFVFRTKATQLGLVSVEALTDASHGHKSVGVPAHGNAVITNIQVEAASLVDPSKTQKVEFAWAWADHEQPNGDFDIHNVLREDASGWALAGHQRIEGRTALLVAKKPFGFEGGSEVRVTLVYESQYTQHIVGRPRVGLARVSLPRWMEAKAGQTALEALASELPTRISDWWSAGPFKAKDFDTAYDKDFGPESRTTLVPNQKFGKRKWRHRPKLVDDRIHRLRGEQTAHYFGRAIFTPTKRRVQLALGSDDAIKVFLNGKVVHANKALRGVRKAQDKVEVELAAGENLLVVKIVNNGGQAGWYFASKALDHAASPNEPAALMPTGRRDAKFVARYEREWGSARSETYATLSEGVRRQEAAVAALGKGSVPVVIMKELAKPTPTFCLDRGRYDMVNEKRPVTRRPPKFLGLAIPEGAPNNRLGFAKWLVRKDHPLTARVRVNRIWQLIFGNGIVDSSENFGQQANWPSHLELLDWLAVDFMESGWDQKALIRKIVTSATYRQRARASEMAKRVDASNRLLSHFPRQRLQGELVRDLALYVSGLLVDKIGGPSVKPHQPKGLWREVSIGGSSNTQIFRPDSGEKLYRRGLYTFWKRTSPSPQMRTFDAPTREFCIVRRGVTNTPLQVLVLWNDVQFLEAARVLAQRTLQERAKDAERLELMFRRCTGRKPEAKERRVLERMLGDYLERYRKAPADAAKLIKQGDAPLPAEYDANELAAWMLLASAMLSLDETIVRD